MADCIQRRRTATVQRDSDGRHAGLRRNVGGVTQSDRPSPDDVFFCREIAVQPTFIAANDILCASVGMMLNLR